MQIDFFAWLESYNFVKSLGSFLGLVESLDTRLNRLCSSEFESGCKALEEACYSETEVESLLREARNHFRKATTLEKGERQALSYLGLSFCQWYLQDKNNAIRSLKEILNIKIVSTTRETKTILRNIFYGNIKDSKTTNTRNNLQLQLTTSIFLGGLYGMSAFIDDVNNHFNQVDKKIVDLETLQQQVKIFLANLER